MSLEVVHHPDRGTHEVTPEVAAALLRKDEGWTRDHDPESIEAQIEHATAPLKERIAELEAQIEHAGDTMPDDAKALVAWIGENPERATQAAAAEAERSGNPRKTVTDHIESVLTPTPTDPAANGQED